MLIDQQLERSRVTTIDESQMSASAIITTNDPDRVGDIVIPSLGDVTKYRKNPVVMWDHGLTYTLPIAKCEHPNGSLAIQTEPDRWIATAYFSNKSEMSEQVFGLICDGIIRATSIRFSPLESPTRSDGYRKFGRWELEEWSFCPIGVNPEAVIEVVQKGTHRRKKLHYAVAKSLAAAVQQSNVAVPPRKTIVRVGWDAMKKSFTQLPLGAQILIATHSELKALDSNLDAAMGGLENPNVKTALEEIKEAINRLVESLEGGYQTEYKEDMPAYEDAPPPQDPLEQGDDMPGGDYPEDDEMKCDGLSNRDGMVPREDEDTKLKSFLSGGKLNRYRANSVLSRMEVIAKSLSGDRRDALLGAITYLRAMSEEADPIQEELDAMRAQVKSLTKQLKAAIPLRKV